MRNAKLNKVLPHGDIKEVFQNVWFIQGQVKMPMLFPPLKASKSMTVVRDPSKNALTIINAMPLAENMLEELCTLGDIKNTLRIGGFHGRDDEFYKQRFGTKAYALQGHVYSKKFDKIPKTDPKEGYFQPDVFLDETGELPIPHASLKIFSTSNPIEAVLVLDQNKGIIVSADSLHNTQNPDQFCNYFAKKILKKFGFYKAYNVGPGWVQFAKPSLADIRSILDLDFDNVLPGHGDPVIGGAKEKYRPVIEGKIKGCHQ